MARPVLLGSVRGQTNASHWVLAERERRSAMRGSLTVLLALVGVAGLGPGDADVPGLLSLDDLQRRLAEPGLRVLDARPRS